MNFEQLTHYVFLAGSSPDSLKKLHQAALRSAGLAFVYIGTYEGVVPARGKPLRSLLTSQA